MPSIEEVVGEVGVEVVVDEGGEGVMVLLGGDRVEALQVEVSAVVERERELMAFEACAAGDEGVFVEGVDFGGL